MTNTLSRDERGKTGWNEAYGDLDGRDRNLWGDPPAPYAAKAGKLFSDNSAFTVLDLPCGDGRNLPTLALSAPVVLACDTSRNALGIAESTIRRADSHRNIVFREADIFSLPFPSDSIDGIFCWDMLGHLTEPEKAIRELYRVCKPGGHIVANMWTTGDCQPRDSRISEIGPKEYVDHLDLYLRCYDRADLEALLSSAGVLAESTFEVETWVEPPHAGYRPYWHEHECLIFTTRKTTERGPRR